MEDTRFDSLIFDMDGTLWDAVDTYCLIWNTVYEQIGVDSRVTRPMLIDCMGMPIEKIVEKIAPAGIDTTDFLRRLGEVNSRLLPLYGGRLYDGVAEYIPKLAQCYKLFMVSNCGKHGLEYFLDYTKLRPYFIDTLSHGQTGLPKEGNIKILADRYNLTTPIYIGDTEGDCRSAHAAGVPMLHVTYGFGQCTDADFSADSFQQVADIFLSNQ